jgi:hypothetical protein
MPGDAVRGAARLRLPVYLASAPPPGMRVLAPLRASARGPGAHLDLLLADIDRRAVALRAEAVAVRAIRVGGERTLTEIPRPCAPEVPSPMAPARQCTDALTGTELDMTVEAEALRGPGGGWAAPPPLSGDGGVAE